MKGRIIVFRSDELQQFMSEHTRKLLCYANIQNIQFFNEPTNKNWPQGQLQGLKCSHHTTIVEKLMFLSLR